MVIEQVNNYINYIPKIISVVRDLIVKGIELFNLPVDTTSTFIFLGIAILLGYYWLKQFIVQGLFFKISTLLNWLLLSILFFLVFTRVS